MLPESSREPRSLAGGALALACVAISLVMAARRFPETWTDEQNDYAWSVVAGLATFPLFLGWRSAAPLLVTASAGLASLAPWATWDVYDSGRGTFPGLPGVSAGHHGLPIVAIAAVCFLASWVRFTQVPSRALFGVDLTIAVALLGVVALACIDVSTLGDRWSGPGLRMTLVGAASGVAAAAWCAVRAWKGSPDSRGSTRGLAAAAIVGSFLLVPCAQLPLIRLDDISGWTYWMSNISYGTGIRLALIGLVSTGATALALALRRRWASRAAACVASLALLEAVRMTIDELATFRWAQSGNPGAHAIGAYVSPVVATCALVSAIAVAIRGGSGFVKWKTH